eukprot:CAMPEP_0117426724 /NCGR_PEP_ID=MMETSP0758-20121206/6760_1 /TAXON_ID=63605 /ORGANISM="Percolomonas cosmopolitus, Strain AE-1 (ATCC 50343)" /LENGTH=200 /DNA_ID=CAMNT_0005212023 /DNA_START=559 /DNA_END=1158 /DNA_ORIENTATION=+
MYGVGQMQNCPYEGTEGKPAVTHLIGFAHVDVDGKEHTYVMAAPITGRTHQIRLHCQYIGHPILNDVFYGYDALDALFVDAQLDVPFPDARQLSNLSMEPFKSKDSIDHLFNDNDSSYKTKALDIKKLFPEPDHMHKKFCDDCQSTFSPGRPFQPYIGLHAFMYYSDSLNFGVTAVPLPPSWCSILKFKMKSTNPITKDT